MGASASANRAPARALRGSESTDTPARALAEQARGVQADIEILGEKGEAGGLLLNAVQRVGANLLVAGAFGHPRLQEFIFGGTTRTLLAAPQPSLFLSH